MKQEFTQALKSKNVQDYSYAIMFFLVASFFAFAVIRPVLGIAVSIRREGEDLKRVNETYEKNITRVLELQSEIENVRSKRYLLDEALPAQPQIQDVIEDIQQAGSDAQVEILSVEIDPLTLKSAPGAKVKKPAVKKTNQKSTTQAQTIGASIDVATSFDGVNALLQAIVNQRRVKRINAVRVTLVKGKKTDEPSVVKLNVTIELEGYYLASKAE
jgi:Tfp pilus assembly protein PilO